MQCEDLRSLIEPLAEGDMFPSAEVAAHLESCAACAADLALARRIHRLLGDEAVAAAPAGFVPGVMGRLRRDRWRAEQYLDLGFNAAVIASTALVVGGVWMALNLTGLAAVTGGTVEVFTGGLAELARRIAPHLPVYAGAVTLMLTALAVWWWAERGWSV